MRNVSVSRLVPLIVLGIAVFSAETALAKRPSFVNTAKGLYEKAIYFDAKLSQYADANVPSVRFMKARGGYNLLRPLKGKEVINDWKEYKEAAGTRPLVVKLTAPRGAQLTKTDRKVLKETVAIYSKHNDARLAPALSIVHLPTGKVIASAAGAEGFGLSWFNGAATEGFTQ